MTNEELMRQYQTNPAKADNALSQLCEQNMGLVWDLAKKCAADFGIGSGDPRAEDMKEELSIDGVYKARDAAVEHAKAFYYGSELHTWRRAYVDTKVTANRGLK